MAHSQPSQPSRFRHLSTQLLLQSTLWLIRQRLTLTSFVAPRIAGQKAFRLFCTPRPYSPKPKEAQILASGRRRELPHNDSSMTNGRLVGYTWNDAGAQTVLLVHGWELNAGRMTSFVQPLVEQGFRVVAFNAPAHGGKNERSSGTWTNGLEYGRAIQRVIESQCGGAFYENSHENIHGSVHGIIAHSIGCLATAYFLAYLNPNGAENVVFIAPPSRLGDFIKGFQATLGLPERVARLLKEHFEAGYNMTVRAFDLRLMAKKITMPMLLIHDREDAVCSFDYAQTVAAEAPNCEFVPTEKLGHILILRSPEVMGRVTAFLSSSTMSDLVSDSSNESVDQILFQP